MDLSKRSFIFSLVRTGSTGTDIGDEAIYAPSQIEENANEIVSVKKALSRVYARLLFKFQSDIEKYPSLVEGHVIEAKEYFARTLDKIAELEPDNVIFSLTHSNSLYFRIYKGSRRAHVEVFFDYDGSKDDIEMVSTVYLLNNQVLNIATDFERGFAKIIEEVSPISYTTIENPELKYEVA